MALVLGTGEVTSRLGAYLALRGKLGFGIDETVVPVIPVLDATQPPYRTDGYLAFRSLISPASPLNLSAFLLENNGSGPVVLRGLMMTAQATSRVLMQLRTTVLPTVTSPLLTGERGAPRIGIPAAVGVGGAGFSSPVNLNTQANLVSIITATWIEITVGVTSVGSGFMPDFQVTIPSGAHLAMECQVVNSAFTASVAVQVFEQPT